MTITFINNSVLRVFFEKQKLTGPNFIDWYRNLRIVMLVEDNLTYLEHPILVFPVLSPRQELPLNILAAHTTWVKASKEIVEQELLQTVREFHACKHKEGQSMSFNVLRTMSYIKNLERSHPMSLNYNMHGMGKTVNELHAMLKLHEQTLPNKYAAPALLAIRAGRIQKNNHKNKKSQMASKGNNQRKGKTKFAYAPKPKNPPPSKKDNPAKDVICHQCDEGLRESKKLKTRALNLYVENGHRAVDEAIGTFHLCLSSGLVVVLNNCHFAPSITRGIISVRVCMTMVLLIVLRIMDVRVQCV
ncbi:hypothetical protein Tco_0190279 [Tanacetum coccineum]